MKHGDRKQDENGFYEWHQPEGTSGWWSRIEDENLTQHRIPLTCPGCKELLDNWSADFYNRWGVCSNCYYNYLEGRELLKMSNTDRATYCNQKIAEKETIK